MSWSGVRSSQGIRCILDPLGENANSRGQAEKSVKAYRSCIKAIHSSGLNSSVSVKLTAIGALHDKEQCLKNALDLLKEASASRIGFEIDMEGAPLVDFTIKTAIACAEVQGPITLAIQAYLDRTNADLEGLLGTGIRIRLVKGAYLGDVTVFWRVQDRFKRLFDVLLKAGAPFCVGTHDIDLLEEMKQKADGDRDLVEFGFLMGLADSTKVEMAGDGWRVAEYVPFGDSRVAYEARRVRYLRELEEMGLKPAP